MNVRGSAALWSRLAGCEATFLFPLKISVGVQGKYPARWLWNADEGGEHPWAGLEEKWSGNVGITESQNCWGWK